MAAGPSKARKLETETSELNLIPIMNLFIVIIPMLLLITVTVHMAMLQITLPSTGSSSGNGDNEQANEKKQIVALLQDRFKIITVGGEDEDIDIPIRNAPTDKVLDRYNFHQLNQELQRINPQENHEWKTIGVMPNPDTRYDLLLLVIDLCKKNHLEVTYRVYDQKYFQVAQ